MKETVKKAILKEVSYSIGLVLLTIAGYNSAFASPLSFSFGLAAIVLIIVNRR